MKVYVLERDPLYHDDCSYILGVFSTREKAEEIIAEKNQINIWTYDVTEHELDRLEDA